MTSEEILNLSDPELVEAVAIHPKIMGWKREVFRKRQSLHSEAWSPLTDENALAEVREKMVENWGMTTYHSPPYFSDKIGGKNYVITFWKSIPFSSSGPSYARTLLQAALMAVNEEPR